jgi:non-specific serine/threonine protein kinase/serine/threonine-protein kinase
VTPERWERIKQLFESALAQAPERRAEFLARACGADSALHAELASLLASYEPDASGGSAGPVDSSSIEDAGQRLGPYAVIRRIGAGGMGVVYLAARADDAYQKLVAIKVVQASVDAQSVLARFRAERQILATLDHPNIARLLDGGTTDRGLPFFVMDYVEGTRIDDYCDRHTLSTVDRVKIFRDVCSAVQYVHQHLVVHRDLKPSNILVTADGVPKLLDFGIAKVLKGDLFTHGVDATQAEFRVMTPGYASPEQARGAPVTTVSDVYTLGVILYELLTGRRPYKLKTDAPLETLRAVCDQDPEKPSSAAPARSRRELVGDLDAIVLKALRKEPHLRYGSVEQLSEDLRRHLERLPVRAHVDSWSYRASKFVGRHQTAVIAATLAVGLLVAGVLATLWQARIARVERARAERQFDDVRQLSTAFLFEFHSAIQDLPGATPARQLLVERALVYLNKLAAEAAGDRRLQRELAEAYLKVGDVQGNPYIPNVGDSAGAAASYRRSLDISRTLVDANPTDVSAKLYLARSYRALGDVLPQLGQPSEAVEHLGRATGIYESLIASGTEDASLREELARSYQALGDVQGHSGLQNLGDPVAALDSYRKSLTLYDGLIASDARSPTARRGKALLEIRIGDLQELKDDLPAAVQAYGTALTLSESLAAEDPTNAEDARRLALAYRKAGGIQEDLGNYPRALADYAKAESLNERIMRADPANVQARMGYVISVRWSGDLLKLIGDTDAALVKYRRVLEILETLAATQPANVTVRSRHAEMLIVAARLLAGQGELDEARRLTKRGLTLTRELASRPDVTPDDLSQYALDFLTCEPADLREPSTALRYATASVDKSGGSDSGNLDILAQAYFQSGDRTRAIDTEERAMSLLAPPVPGQPDPPMRRRIESQLAKFKTQTR